MNPSLMPDDHVVSEPALRRFAQRLRPWLAGQIEALDAGSFALVMATGIISNSLFFETRPLLSDALFAANLVAYALLLVFIKLTRLPDHGVPHTWIIHVIPKPRAVAPR